MSIKSERRAERRARRADRPPGQGISEDDSTAEDADTDDDEEVEEGLASSSQQADGKRHARAAPAAAAALERFASRPRFEAVPLEEIFTAWNAVKSQADAYVRRDGIIDPHDKVLFGPGDVLAMVNSLPSKTLEQAKHHRRIASKTMLPKDPLNLGQINSVKDQLQKQNDTGIMWSGEVRMALSQEKSSKHSLAIGTRCLYIFDAKKTQFRRSVDLKNIEYAMSNFSKDDEVGICVP
jgi:hypothetical protein